MTSATDLVEGPARPPLRVALVISGPQGPAWLEGLIRTVGATGEAVITDVIFGSGVGGPRAGATERAMLRAYGWIDERLFARPDEPTRIVDLGPTIDEVTRPGAPATHLETEPDVVVRLDGDGRPLDRWPTPTFGTWSLEHGTSLPASCRGGRLKLAPGGLEMLLGQSFTISQLVTGSGDERRVIGQVVSAVDRLSLLRGSRGHLGKLPGLVARAVSAVRSDGTLPDPIIEDAADGDAPTGTSLGIVTIAAGLGRVLVGFGFRLLRRTVAPERWLVATTHGRPDLHDGDRPVFRFLEAPEGREWADPFPLRTPDADLVFLEEFVTAELRGRLAVVELDDSSRGWRSAETILELPTHLSYPFVFEWSGTWYLLPEQAATGRLELYVAEDFPGSWRWHSTVLDFPAADATIAEIDGRWWLFAAASVPGGSAADELHLFHADTPLGPWTAHARNPVVSDVRSARPAGRLYQRDGSWYRVAQDGAISYGHSIAIVRIDRIDLNGYRQTVVDVIRPDWAPRLVATHTLNEDDGLTALDALRRRSRFARRRPPA